MSAEVKVEKKIVCSPFDRIHKTATAALRPRPGISYVYLFIRICHAVDGLPLSWLWGRRLIKWEIHICRGRSALCVVSTGLEIVYKDENSIINYGDGAHGRQLADFPKQVKSKGT